MNDEFQEKRVTQYLIPANVTTRFEFFEGFGWYELKIVTIALIIGSLIFFALGIPKHTVKVTNPLGLDTTTAIDNAQPEYKSQPIVPTLPRALAILVPGISAFVVVKRNPSTGMSFITILKAAREFKHKQKRYLYKYNSGREN